MLFEPTNNLDTTLIEYLSYTFISNGTCLELLMFLPISYFLNIL
nr:MAG TPA: hypothetical protein [Caudoviricetes sp.]